MKYYIKASSSSKKNASLKIKESEIVFGTTPESADNLPNPAELFLGSFAACILKNVERFSILMKFEYSNAEDNSLNINLLKKNIEKFGTIFNTVKSSCSVIGDIKKISK